MYNLYLYIYSYAIHVPPKNGMILYIIPSVCISKTLTIPTITISR
jgi:hypothetical protein